MHSLIPRLLRLVQRRARCKSRIPRISLSKYRRRDEKIRRFAQTSSSSSSSIQTDAARLIQPCSDHVCFRCIRANAIIGPGYSVIARHVGIFFSFAFEERRDHSAFKRRRSRRRYNTPLSYHRSNEPAHFSSVDSRAFDPLTVL